MYNICAKERRLREYVRRKMERQRVIGRGREKERAKERKNKRDCVDVIGKNNQVKNICCRILVLVSVGEGQQTKKNK